MTEVRFYHLQRTSLEAALPKMLEKLTQERAGRAVVMVSSPERAEAITAQLWTYSPPSFLPHGNERDGNAAQQPIWITARDENPNGAEYLFLCDGAESAQLANYRHCADLFDGTDPDALAAARRRWAECKKAGHSLIYYQQTEAGKWEQKAMA